MEVDLLQFIIGFIVLYSAISLIIRWVYFPTIKYIIFAISENVYFLIRK